MPDAPNVPAVAARRWCLTWVVSFVALALWPHSTPAAPAPRQIDEAVAQLGSADPAAREKAMRSIWSAGRSAEPALQRALDDPRTAPEAAVRARGLLQKIRLGVGPDTPPEVVRLVTQYSQGDAAERLDAARELLKGGETTAGTLVRLWVREKDRDVRQKVAEGLAIRARLYAQLLLLDGEESAAASLLDAAADRTPAAAKDWAAYLLVKGELAERLRNADPPAPPTFRAGWMSLVGGDTTTAQKFAADQHDDALLAAVQWAKGDWTALAAEYDRRAARAADPLIDLTLAAAFHRLAGEETELDAALDRLAAYARSHNGTAFQCAEPFLLAGRVRQGIDLMKEENPAGAVDLLGAQLHYDELFALLERTTKPSPDGKPPPAARYTQAAFWYARVGGDERAARLLEGALRSADLAAVDGADDQGWSVGAVARIEVMMGRRDRAAERCLEAVTRGRPDALVGALFPPAALSEARVGWRGFRALYPDDTPRATLDRIDRLLAGKSPADEVDRWAARARPAALRAPDFSQQAALTRAVASVLLGYGKDADALACVEALESAPAPTAVTATPGMRGGGPIAAGYMQLADRAASAGRWDDAASLYGRARAALGDDARRTVLPAYLEGRALVKAGQADEGNKRITRARLVPLADVAARALLAEGLRQRGLLVEAAAEWSAILPLSDHNAMEASDPLRHAATDAARRGDFARAADLLGRSNVAVYRPEASFRQPTAYLALARLADDWRARAQLKAGDVPAAATTLRAAAELFPVESDWAIGWILDLEKNGHRAEADALFNQQFAAFKATCERYPNAADAHNGLAWLAGRCGRELDAALDHASRAVALHPERGAYLDTLAEVHFRRGERAKAVERMKQAVELEPKNAYYHAQLKRFESTTPVEWKPPGSAAGEAAGGVAD